MMFHVQDEFTRDEPGSDYLCSPEVGITDGHLVIWTTNTSFMYATLVREADRCAMQARVQFQSGSRYLYLVTRSSSPFLGDGYFHQFYVTGGQIDCRTYLRSGGFTQVATEVPVDPSGEPYDTVGVDDHGDAAAVFVNGVEVASVPLTEQYGSRIGLSWYNPVMGSQPVDTLWVRFGPAFSVWDGSVERPALASVWDGAVEQPVAGSDLVGAP